MKNRSALMFLGFAAFSLSILTVQAEGHHRRPPPEALNACKGLKAGDPCSFSVPEGDLEGSCFTPAQDKPLACRPENAPENAPEKGEREKGGREGGGPPPCDEMSRLPAG